MKSMIWVIVLLITVAFVGFSFSCNREDEEEDESDFQAPSAPEGWRIEKIGEGEYYYAEFVVDSQNRPHVTYGDLWTFYYSMRIDDGWMKQTMLNSEEPILTPVFAIDGTNRLHFGYVEERYDDELGEGHIVTYGVYENDDWHFSPVAECMPFSTNSKLSMSASPGGVITLVCDGIVWSNQSGDWLELAANSMYMHDVFALGDDEFALVGCIEHMNSQSPEWYTDKGNYLLHMFQGQWTGERIMEFADDFANCDCLRDQNLLSDQEGYSHVLTKTGRGEEGLTYYLDHLTNLSGQWKKKRLFSYYLSYSAHGGLSSAIDSKGQVHLLQWNPEDGEILYLHQNGEEWIVEPLVKTADSRIVLDDDDYAHVLLSFYEGSEYYHLYYMTNRPASSD